MAKEHTRLIAVAVFGIGMWAALTSPSVAVYVLGTSRPMVDAEWELLFEVSAFTATAAAAGFAVVGCRSVLRALCAVPIAALLISLIPSHWALWLSDSLRSIVVNAIVAGLVFAAAGAAAGLLASRLFKRGASHA